MNVTLKSISLKNFKGIKEFATEFNGVTTISGQNGTGKSTIFDAFLWLFFGKDSHDKTDFEVKTLLTDGTPIHKLDYEVKACLLVDGQEKYFKRTLREKWVKKRGEEISEMQGHETLFEINSAPYQAGEYKVKVNEVIQESIFKLVSSPAYFNSLPWKERRNILTSICGVIPEPDGYDFIKQKAREIGIDKYKVEISAKKKLLKDELLLVPARIDEVFKSTPEPVNETELSKQISEAEKRIKFLGNEIEDAAKRFNARNQDNLLKQRTVHELKVKLQGIQMRVEDLNRNAQGKIDQQVKDADSLKSKFLSEIGNINEDLKRKALNIEIIEKEIAALREDWNMENEKQLVFKEDELNCPACGRPLDDIESKKAEMTASFNTKKIAALESINRDGQAKKVNITRLNAEIKESEKAIKDKDLQVQQLTGTLDALKSQTIEVRDYKKEPDYIATQKEIEGVIFEEITPEDTSAIKSESDLLRSKIEAANKLLTLAGVAEKNKIRLEELHAREKELSQLIADLEKIEFQIEGYTRSFITEVETKVNSMFTLCKFKMFTTLLNGGIEEACECLVNGVPYSSNLNSAMKINAGIDIINVLSKYYKVTAPLFVDNRESTNELIPTESQIINLVVTTDQVLTVSNN